MRTLSPDEIEKLQQLKNELEVLTNFMQNTEGKSEYEIESRVREYQEKESEIKRFLHENGLV